MENTMRSKGESDAGGAGTRSGFEPLRRLYRRYVVLGVAVIAAGVLYGALAGGAVVWLAPSVAVALGGCFIALGAWGLHVGAAAQTLSSSLNLLQAGKLGEASALLDTLEGSTAARVVTSRHLQRAMIAVRRGDLDAVIRHADLALAGPWSVLLRATHEIQRGAAFGLRAFARAAKGDLEGATSDVRVVRQAGMVGPDALAHAALAEAIVLERRGDRAGLAAHLGRQRRLLMSGLDVRERAVVRAMQRLLAAAPRSVYRTAAEPKKADVEDEPPLVEWLDKVAPQLSAFAPKLRAAAPATAVAPPVLTPSAEAIAQVKAQAPKKSAGPLLKLVGLWALLVTMFLAIWQYAEPSRERAARLPRPPPLAPEPLSALWGIALAVFLIAFFAWIVIRNQAQARKLHGLMAAITRGDDVDAELAELAASKLDLAAAQAELLRSAVADRRGQLAQGIAHIDAGRARLRTEALRAAASGMLAPSLTGARAYLLAAMGRADEAAAELAQIPPDYLLHDRTRFAVQLVALLACGDVDGAGRLVDATSPDISIGPRDELLRDLVRAATAPSGAGSLEIARLRAELREDDESRRWIEQVAPALIARFDQAAAPPDDAEDTAAIEAEREAAAEAEAAFAPGPRAVAPPRER
jgi:hypothetical protein